VNRPPDPAGHHGQVNRPPDPAGPDALAGRLFEHERPRLLGLAYRMLGTVADAEDVVQEAWLRWRAADVATIERPEAWLTTVTTRVALDLLKAVQRRREDYVGPWLPEPVVLTPGPAESAELAESLTLGFLTMLDELGPLERAVFLLADVFSVPHAEIAVVVGRSEAACRQIASRARRRFRDVRHTDAPHVQAADRRLVDEFVAAIGVGDIDAALARLAPDVVLVSDGGPTRRAARHPVVGRPRVVRLLVNLASRLGGSVTVERATVNGDPGVILSIDGEQDTAAAFELRDGLVTAIWLIRNPDKLTHLQPGVVLA
jgi:RNA polymerase sigma-70 factor (ECF subfamily)